MYLTPRQNPFRTLAHFFVCESFCPCNLLWASYLYFRTLYLSHTPSRVIVTRCVSITWAFRTLCPPKGGMRECASAHLSPAPDTCMVVPASATGL